MHYLYSFPRWLFPFYRKDRIRHLVLPKYILQSLFRSYNICLTFISQIDIKQFFIIFFLQYFSKYLNIFLYISY